MTFLNALGNGLTFRLFRPPVLLSFCRHAYACAFVYFCLPAFRYIHIRGNCVSSVMFVIILQFALCRHADVPAFTERVMIKVGDFV